MSKENKNISKSKKFSINVIANIFGRIWSMISVYIFIPFYIKFLGQETYGLVTFFATLYTVMNLLGLGLSKTLRREFASGEDTDNSKLHKYQMMRSVEVVYIGISLFIMSLCFFGANYIAEKWLNIGSLNFETVAVTIRLMGVSIGIQILTNMYSGCLFGLEYQVRANIYQIGWSVVKNLGVILLLWLIAGDVRLFYAWHVFADICYLIVLRFTVVRLLRGKLTLKWSIDKLSNLKHIWKFAFGLLLVSLVYALNTQLDKAVISKYLSLVELGAYNVAYSLGNLTSVLATAIATAAFSRFTNYYTNNQIEKQKESFTIFTKISGLTVIAIGTFIAVYSYELLQVWTRNETIASLARGPASYIVVGSIFSSLQIVPYEFMLSRGNTKINNLLGISSIPYTLIVTPYLVRQMGILGAAIAWCILMPISTCIYLSYIHRKYIGNGTIHWLITDTLLPFVLSLVMAFLSRWLSIKFTFSLLETILFAVISGTVVVFILFLIFDRELLKYISREFSQKVSNL